MATDRSTTSYSTSQTPTLRHGPTAHPIAIELVAEGMLVELLFFFFWSFLPCRRLTSCSLSVFCFSSLRSFLFVLPQQGEMVLTRILTYKGS